MIKYSIFVTDAADSDLGDIFEYIAISLQEPATAAKLVSELYDAISELAAFPLRCPAAKDTFLAKQGFRTLFVKKYIVFYVVNEKDKTVIVHRIIYGKRQYRTLFSIE